MLHTTRPTILCRDQRACRDLTEGSGSLKPRVDVTCTEEARHLRPFYSIVPIMVFTRTKYRGTRWSVFFRQCQAFCEA
ncbi:hypothetical protein HBH82_027380 [Parastagonospora nodorum]|nr:hypothetical protein HBH82_027380 [Parastagonospora nodorum]